MNMEPHSGPVSPFVSVAYPAVGMKRLESEPSLFLATSLVPIVLILVTAGLVMRRRDSLARRAISSGALEDSSWLPDSEMGSFLPTWESTLFCPVCQCEFVASEHQCEDCGVELVEEDELPVCEPQIDQDVVRVARLSSSSEGHIIRNILQRNRVPCTMTRWDFAGADVYVFESDALRARRLIRQCLIDIHTPC